MKAIESYFENLELTDLEKAFEEYKSWRSTGVLEDGILRSTYEKIKTELDLRIFPGGVVEPFLYVLITRIRK